MNHFLVAIQAIALSTSILASSLSTRPAVYGENSVLINVIEGTVYDPRHNPVPDMWVEMLNDFNLTLYRKQTSSSGRFTFSGFGSGHYYIKVYTTGTNFEEQTQSVDVVNVVQNSSDAIYLDVNLRYDRNKTNIGTHQLTDTVFVQDVPEEARRLYKSGSRDLASKDFKKGADEIDAALKIFPDYYDALNALGCNYVDIREYQKSLPYLIRSIDVNRRSFTSFYSLAYAAYKLERLPEAVEAAAAAVVLQPNSVNAQLLYGTTLRMSGRTEKALETLLKAEKMSKDSPVPEVHWQLAMAFNKLKRNKEAADQLDTYLRLLPNAANKKQVQELIRQLRA
jgi:tetratricopeptide (TPR) repeat protein